MTFDITLIPVKQKVTADPAAGAQPNGLFGMGTTLNTILYGCELDLTTDANAANRTVKSTINFGTYPMVIVVSTTVQTATLTNSYKFVFGMPIGTTVEGSGANAIHTIGLGLLPVKLPIGSTVSFFILNKQAGDDATATGYFVQEGPA